MRKMKKKSTSKKPDRKKSNEYKSKKANGKKKQNETLKKKSYTKSQKTKSQKKKSTHKKAKRKIKNVKTPIVTQFGEPIELNSELGQNLLSKNKSLLSIIISAHNEESTIEPILDVAMKLEPKEIIIIENGSTDRTLEICLKYPVKIYSYSVRLGHDVGRAVGASKATGDVLLFIDGDILIEPSLLLAFVKPCYEGVDITLNNLDPLYENSSKLDYASMAKNYLNRLLLRRDLGFCSLTAIPHAMTKEAANNIGIENLAVPPKAQAIALYQNLKVEKAVTVNVFKSNKIRNYINEVGKLILGDHIEAINWLQEKTSPRANFTNDYRLRTVINE